MFMNIVNTIVAGSLGALIANAAGAQPVVIVVVGAVSALAYLAATIQAARRIFTGPSIPAHFPSPPG
jgi:uncharacterized membrane protein YcaP (DUF421 family)